MATQFSVIINGRFLTQKITGVQRYAIELVKALDKLMVQGYINSNLYQIRIIYPRASIVNDLVFRHLQVFKTGFFQGHFWEQIELPIITKNNLLINFCNTGPLIKKRQLITLHDAAVFRCPHNYSFMFGTWYRLLMPLLIKRSHKVVTVSKFSRRELGKVCKISDKKIMVIYEGREHFTKKQSDHRILEKYDLIDKKYILAVSSLATNKNFISIINAIAMMGKVNFEFVIAGGSNSKVFTNSVELSEQVKHVGYVTDEELKALYENASCFVFPSLYEGFGLPPLEAMACGCPVIVSNRASMPEVCGEAAIYIDPLKPEDIVEKIMLVMSNEKLRSELKRKGLERAREFSWEKCAKEFWDLIKGELNS